MELQILFHGQSCELAANKHSVWDLMSNLAPPLGHWQNMDPVLQMPLVHTFYLSPLRP